MSEQRQQSDTQESLPQNSNLIELHRQEYHQFLTSPDQIKGNVAWMTKQMIQARKTLGAFEFNTLVSTNRETPIEIQSLRGDFFIFLEESDLHYLGFSDKDAISVIETIKSSPHLLIALESLSIVQQKKVKRASYETHTPVLPLINAIRGRGRKTSERDQATDFPPLSPEAEELAKVFHITHASEASISSLALRIAEMASFLKETCYWQFTIEKAAEILKHIAPNLSSYIDTAIQKTLLIKSRAAEKEEIDWSMSVLGTLYPLLLQSDYPAEDVENKHAFHLFVICHELLHMTVVELFLDKNIKITKFSDNKVDLFSIILEAISVGNEPAVIEYLHKAGLPEEAKHMVEEFVKLRLSTLRQAHKITNESAYRKLLLQTVEDTSDEADHLYVPLEDRTSIRYSQGVRLAIALKNRGWTINDLPEFAVKVRDILGFPKYRIFQLNPTYPNTLLLNLDPSSKFQRIMSKIKRLKRVD